MDVPLTTGDLFLGSGAVVLGAVVQATSGIGAGLLLVPLLSLINPALVPGPLILSALSLMILMTVRGRRQVIGEGLPMVIAGMLLGALAAYPVIGLLRGAATDLLFGAMLFGALAISLAGRMGRPTRRGLLAVGAVSAFMGATAAVGGPVLALAYQTRSGAEVRATLSALALIGSLMILATIGAAGRLGTAEALAGLMLVPAWMVGDRLAAPLARRLDGRRFRPFLLVLCGLGAAALTIRGMMGVCMEIPVR